MSSRIVTPERHADDVGDATRPQQDVTARLRRLVAIVLVFLVAGPPIGGVVFSVETLATDHSHGHAVSPEAVLASFEMVLLCYLFGAPFALVSGTIHAIAAIWWQYTSILLPLVTGSALGTFGAAALVWILVPPEFGNFWRELKSALLLLPPVTLIATLVCWHLTRRLMRAG